MLKKKPQTTTNLPAKKNKQDLQRKKEQNPHNLPQDAQGETQCRKEVSSSWQGLGTQSVKPISHDSWLMLSFHNCHKQFELQNTPLDFSEHKAWGLDAGSFLAWPMGGVCVCVFISFVFKYAF